MGFNHEGFHHHHTAVEEAVEGSGTPMRIITIKKGLDLPMEGVPRQEIVNGPPVSTVAVVGPDYIGMKPTMLVQVGDRVKLGQPLFEDKKTPGILYTSPGSGEVVGINRGAKRALESVVVRLEGEDAVTFERFEDAHLVSSRAGDIRKVLIESGMWAAFRTRPHSKVPAPDASAQSIFVTAVDTHPLAADPRLVIGEQAAAFARGVKVLTLLSAGPVFLCQGVGDALPGSEVEGVESVAFAGPHPAGLPGTHIHFLDPVNRNHMVWYISYQDVIAIGHLMTTGKLFTQRVISLAGPGVKEPRLIRTRLGAQVSDLVKGALVEAEDKEWRVVSGSILSGRQVAQGGLYYLGRYHNQITVLEERGKLTLLGWYRPGADKYSVARIVISRFRKGQKIPLTTTLNGGARAIFPSGAYEKVMPLDILATPLLRALAIDDIEQAEALGCLELDEEDLALCTFACPGKNDFGPMLRRNLTTIEKEG
jgi:Na+-transporting NADH:ubiquinone oxidoreductase subunit A